MNLLFTKQVNSVEGHTRSSPYAYLHPLNWLRRAWLCVEIELLLKSVVLKNISADRCLFKYPLQLYKHPVILYMHLFLKSFLHVLKFLVV